MLTPPRKHLAIYIHWPFCLSKCPYCDFNSHVQTLVDKNRWKRALCADLNHRAQKTEKYLVTSIFFGGGTPSLMPPEIAASVILEIKKIWITAKNVEITLEANPTSSEAESFSYFRDAGINRLSLGVQSLDDQSLKFLGREHNSDEAINALESARSIFPRISFDMIYARSHQTVESWKLELMNALALASGHISLYQLTFEKGTAFYSQLQKGQISQPNEKISVKFFEATQQMTQTAGYDPYEISNYARRPEDACTHNLSYWRYNDFLGIGPGAHSRIQNGLNGTFAFSQHTAPENWLKAVEKSGHGTNTTQHLTTDQSAQEMLMMGLRLSEGINKNRFFERIGIKLEKFINISALKRLQKIGFLFDNQENLRVTPPGRVLLNSVISDLLSV